MKQLFLLIIISLSFLFLSFLPNFYEASLVNQLPKDRTMLWGEHIYTYDYNVYLSKIRQGAEGRWTVVDKYDNYPNQKGVFLQMFYLLSGKLMGMFNFSPTLTYHLMRTIVSFIWVFTIIFLNVYFLKKPRLYFLGTILSLLASSFPVFMKLDNQFWVGYYMNWWQEMDVIKRISFIPHDTLNYIIVACFSLFLYLYAKTRQRKYFLTIIVVLLFSFFIHPIAGVIFIFSWILFHLIKFSFDKLVDKKQLIIFSKETLTLFFVAAIPLLYISFVALTYPWKSLIDFDQNNRLVFSLKEYIWALGPIVFPGILGIILVIKRKNEKLLSLATWFLSALAGMILFKFFPYQSELRFVQTANHIPLSILSVYFASEMLKKRNTFLNITVYGLVTIIIFFGIIQSVYSIKSQNHFIHQRAVATLPSVPYPPQVMYPLTDFYAGLKWLEQNTKRTDVVLSKITAGNYIPAYSGNFVYLGHIAESPHYNDRVEKVNNFFLGTMSNQEAYNFLKNEKIDYIFYGPQEKENAVKNINSYPFIKPTLELSQVTIFRVKNQ